MTAWAGGAEPRRVARSDTLLKVAGGLLTPLVLALFGWWTSCYLKDKQDRDERFRLYSELMSQRENSESALRKDMFQEIINPFFEPEPLGIGKTVLNLELLAYNFHESLNIEPLFKDLVRRIEEVPSPTRREEYRSRVERVAREVTRKQMLILREAGAWARMIIPPDSLNTPADSTRNPLGVTRDTTLMIGLPHTDGGPDARPNDTERHFRVTVLGADSSTKEIHLRLEVWRQGGETMAHQDHVDRANVVERIEFWVGFFDFPMIDNTRFVDDLRCAIVLETFEPERIELALLYFPGAYAGLKEKPFYNEVLENLRAGAL